MGKKIYAANSRNDTVSVIDVATKEVTARVPVGDYPTDIAVSPNGKKAYVTNSGNYHDPDNTVSVIDTETNTITTTVTVGIYPRGVAVTPDGKKVYVTNAGSDNVSIIDTATNSVTAIVNTGKYYMNHPTGVAIEPFKYPVTKPTPTIKPKNTSFLNLINRTEDQTNQTNQTNNTEVTENAETEGMQEEKFNITQESNGIPFISSFWVLAAVVGAAMCVKNRK